MEIASIPCAFGNRGSGLLLNPDCARKMEQGLEHKDTKGLFCRSDTKRVVLDARIGAKCR